jgi:hypothetical protein
MIRLFFTLDEYLRLILPSAHRRAASSRRAAGTVFPLTFGTTQRACAGGRGCGDGGGGAGGGSAGGGGSVVAVAARAVAGAVVAVAEVAPPRAHRGRHAH